MFPICMVLYEYDRVLKTKINFETTSFLNHAQEREIQNQYKIYNKKCFVFVFISCFEFSGS